jgi:hypothetical protein
MWRTNKEESLKNKALILWKHKQGRLKPEFDHLNAQLEIIKELIETNGQPRDQPDSHLGVNAAALLEKLRVKETLVTPEFLKFRVAYEFCEPPLRLPKIKDVLTHPSRSKTTKSWLDLLRKIHSENYRPGTPPYIYGSAYSNDWPQKTENSNLERRSLRLSSKASSDSSSSMANAINTPADHVIPIRSLQMGASLIYEHADPAQNPANLVLCLNHENTEKKDHVLGIFRKEGDEASKSGQEIYHAHLQVSDEKKAMLAKIIAMMFALYWGALELRQHAACRRTRKLKTPFFAPALRLRSCSSQASATRSSALVSAPTTAAATACPSTLVHGTKTLARC